ncbi:MAG: TSUP family transporter, partial [Candidatus Puniceispirillales bacterium]
MSLYVSIMLAIGALAGGFINGLAGFGTALLALGWWLAILPPDQAVLIVVIMSLISGIYGLREIRHAIKPIRLARYVVPALIGLPFGMALLALTNLLIL